MNIDLILYTGPQCHLCHQAQAVIANANIDNISVNQIDISTDSALFNRFRYAIPVVELVATGQLLTWPFDQQSFLEFIKS